MRLLERLTGISAWGDDLSPETSKLEVKTFKPERNRAWHITRHSNFWKLASLEIWVSNLVGELPYNIRRYQK